MGAREFFMDMCVIRDGSGSGEGEVVDTGGIGEVEKRGECVGRALRGAVSAREALMEFDDRLSSGMRSRFIERAWRVLVRGCGGEREALRYALWRRE